MPERTLLLRLSAERASPEGTLTLPRETFTSPESALTSLKSRLGALLCRLSGAIDYPKEYSYINLIHDFYITPDNTLKPLVA